MPIIVATALGALSGLTVWILEGPPWAVYLAFVLAMQVVLAWKWN